MTQLLVAALLASLDGGDAAAAAVETTESARAAHDGGVAETSPAADAGLQASPADAPVVAPGVAEPVLLPEAGTPAAGVHTAEAVAPSAGFIKGELSMYLGADRLVVKKNRVGVSLGAEFFNQILYAFAEPQVDLRFFDGELAFGLGVPMRFELADLNQSSFAALTQNAGRFRTQDYDSVHDFGRILKYVTYGRKEDHLYVNVGQRYATTIGHGAITRRYAPNLDVEYPRVSAEVDAYNDYAGFELFTNDILEWNQLGGIAFVKPLGFFKPEAVWAKALSVGVSAGLDWNAPLTLRTDNGARFIDAQNRLLASTRPVGLIGFDVETKVVKTEHIDVKPYVDYSFLVGGDGGLTVGALGRFNLGTETVNAFRVVAELRYLGNRYIPQYFDTFYEVERFSAVTDGQVNGFDVFLTKQELVQRGLGNRVGYYLEGSWGIRNVVGFTMALEGDSGSAKKNFVAHVEVPVLSFLQVFASYYKRGFEHLGEFGVLADQRTIIFAGARLRLLPFLFINARAYQTYRVRSSVQRLENQGGFFIDAEIGYEFDFKKAPPPVTGTGATEVSQPAETGRDAPPPAPAAPAPNAG